MCAIIDECDEAAVSVCNQEFVYLNQAKFIVHKFIISLRAVLAAIFVILVFVTVPKFEVSYTSLFN